MENIETLGDYLAMFNPLALKNEKNEILHFKNYDEAYLYVLKDIRRYCKKGYVELPLLIKHLNGFDDESCEELARFMRNRNKDLDVETIFLDWRNIDRQYERLMTIIKVLHEPTETEFAWTSFEYAWMVFKQFNEKMIEKDEKED